MGPLQGFVVGWGINWVVDKIATTGVPEDTWLAEFKAHVEGTKFIPKVLDADIEDAAKKVLDAVSATLKDKTDVSNMLKALAASNPAGAKDALKLLIAPQLPDELAALVKAA